MREKEEREKAAKQLEEKRQEAERREVNTLEEAIRSITAEVEQTAQTEPLAPPVVREESEVAVEDGEISELERVRHYYCRAIKVAATYAAVVENFLPATRPISHYTLQELRTKKANCRTAMMSNGDIITSVLNRKPIATWHGPSIPLPPTDLPDFYKEFEQLQARLKHQYFNN